MHLGGTCIFATDVTLEHVHVIHLNKGQKCQSVSAFTKTNCIITITFIDQIARSFSCIPKVVNSIVNTAVSKYTFSN